MMRLRLTALAVAVFLFVLGMVPFTVGVRWLVFGSRSTGWDKTVGTIEKLEFLGGTGRGAERVIVEFRYEVSGISMVGTRVCFGMPSDQVDGLRRLSAGGKVPVWFDRKNPGSSVLVPGVTSSAKLFFGAGILIVVFAVVAGVSGVRASE